MVYTLHYLYWFLTHWFQKLKSVRGTTAILFLVSEKDNQKGNSIKHNYNFLKKSHVLTELKECDGRGGSNSCMQCACKMFSSGSLSDTHLFCCFIGFHIILYSHSNLMDVNNSYLSRSQDKGLHESAHGPPIVGQFPRHLHHYPLWQGRVAIHLPYLGAAVHKVKILYFLIDCLCIT